MAQGSDVFDAYACPNKRAVLGEVQDLVDTWLHAPETPASSNASRGFSIAIRSELWNGLGSVTFSSSASFQIRPKHLPRDGPGKDNAGAVFMSSPASVPDRRAA